MLALQSQSLCRLPELPATISYSVGDLSLSTAPPTPQPQPSRAAFVFILITVLFDFLAFGIIAPVLPNLIIHFEGGNIARAAAITGYFGFAWALMQFIFSPILGAWSDRFGRRPVILISCFGLGLDYIFMAPSRPRSNGSSSAASSPASPPPTSPAPSPTSPTSLLPKNAPNNSAISPPPSAWASSSAQPWADFLATSISVFPSGPPPASA
jgi:hypothetical protein